MIRPIPVRPHLRRAPVPPSYADTHLALIDEARIKRRRRDEQRLAELQRLIAEAVEQDLAQGGRG